MHVMQCSRVSLQLAKTRKELRLCGKKIGWGQKERKREKGRERKGERSLEEERKGELFYRLL